MQDLPNYIKNLLSQGYSLESIRENLLRYGYSINTIDQAIYELRGGQKQFVITVPMIIGILILLVVGAGFAIFILTGKSAIVPEKLMDVQITSIPDSVAKGDYLDAKIIFTNMGKLTRFDANVKYELLDDSGKSVKMTTETIAIEASKEKDLVLPVPASLGAGQYKLRVTANYRDQLAYAEASFSITDAVQRPINQTSCSDGIRNGDETGVDCGGSCKPCSNSTCDPAKCKTDNPLSVDYCDPVSNQCKHDVPDVCGDGRCTGKETTDSCPADCPTSPVGSTDNQPSVWDSLDKVKQIARTQPDQAKAICDKIDPDYNGQCLSTIAEQTLDADYCQKIVDDVMFDSCYTKLAQATMSSPLCENVKKSTRRDNCYINFVVSKDYTVCDKLQDPYYKKSCESLKDASGT